MSHATEPLRCTLQVLILPHGEGLDLPAYETDGAAGMDLRAAIRERDPLVIDPFERLLVPTGIQVAIPVGFEGQIRPRSGNALKYGLSMPNSPGTIDCDYRGEIKVLVVNLGQAPVTITRGMRIAQLIIAPVARASLQVVEALPESTRGEKGFGSTGKH